MFSVAIHSHYIKEKCINLEYQEKNRPWVYFIHSNLEVGPFGPPPVALGLIASPGSGNKLSEKTFFENRIFCLTSLVR